MNHYHWTFNAWNKDQELGGGQVSHLTQVSIVGYDNEDMALMAARTVIKREEFRLVKVYECNTCAFQEKQIDTLSKLTDAMK